MKVVRWVIGAGILIALAVRVGTAPFLRGLSAIDGGSIAIALLLGAVSTAAMAWRWRRVAEGLGIDLDPSTSVALYYRSQFVNSLLPGGVLGDVDRALTHGRDAQRTADVARSVAIERLVGQVVLITAGIAAFVLVIGVPAGTTETTGVVVALGCVTVALVAVGGLVSASTRIRSVLLREIGMLRVALGTPRRATSALVASVIALACHVTLFAVAAARVGVSAPPTSVVPLALGILLAASIPVNLGGWGPREGAAGWAFAAAGLGASSGVAASTLFGVLALVAVLPGAVAPQVLALLHPPVERNLREPETVRHAQRRHVARRVP